MNITRLLRTVAIVSLALAPAAPAAADRLVAGGTTLAGKVVALSGKGVDFQPEFAKDPMLVPWDKVEDLATDAKFQVLYGDDQEADAPISGYRDGKLLVGDASVDPKDLVAATAMSADELTFFERTRSSMRHWHGSVGAGLNVQRATTDELGALVAVTALRSKGRTRLILGADYRYAEQDDSSTGKRVTKDAAAGLVRGEYDITKNIYAFASTDALYDAIQDLSLRAVPKLGAGYVIWQREPKEGIRDFFQLEAGGGWVYEKYMVNDNPPLPEEDDYFTIAFGAAAAVLLPRGAVFDWRFDYLPAVTDWSDYVIRTSAGLSVPLIAPISARVSVADTYDSTPSGGSKENSLYFDTTLTLAW